MPEMLLFIRPQCSYLLGLNFLFVRPHILFVRPQIVFNVLYIYILFYIMYYIHIVKRFRAHCGFYVIENKLLLLLLNSVTC